MSVVSRLHHNLALEAWTITKQRFERLHMGIEGTLIHHDQDAVYTSYRWTGTLLIDDRVRLSYSTNGARGNTMMESFFGRFKTENRSLLLDAASVQELTQVVGDRIRYYNDQRRHSSLDYRPPAEVLRDFIERQ